ncbi:MAG: hypothetical protein Q9168_002141 [Polycauliona sp. 1 TL-2023]
MQLLTLLPAFFLAMSYASAGHDPKLPSRHIGEWDDSASDILSCPINPAGIDILCGGELSSDRNGRMDYCYPKADECDIDDEYVFEYSQRLGYCVFTGYCGDQRAGSRYNSIGGEKPITDILDGNHPLCHQVQPPPPPPRPAPTFRGLWRTRANNQRQRWTTRNGLRRELYDPPSSPLGCVSSKSSAPPPPWPWQPVSFRSTGS